MGNWLLTWYVQREQERIAWERDWALIANSLQHHLDGVIAAWPDVTFFGRPLTDWQDDELQEIVKTL